MSGRENLATYQITERLKKYFCRSCGVTLLATHSNWPDFRYVPLGTLDSDSGIAPKYHQFTGSRAAWYKIHDSLPQFETWPEVE